MVKRAPTPPPADDEPHHLAVVTPYPPYANMLKHEELIAFIRWLACAMNGHHHHLYAVFHRPSAANMLVIEVSRDFPHFRHLLGAHKWADFVINPGPHRAIYTSNRTRLPAFTTLPIQMPELLKKQISFPNRMEAISLKGKNLAYTQVPVGSGLKKSSLPSHSPLQPIVLDDKPMNGTNAASTRTSSIDTTSKAESTVISTPASNISGTAVTVNGATLTWDFVDDDKGDIGTDLETKFDAEDEIDDYIANECMNGFAPFSAYSKVEENRESGTESHLSSIHPLLVDKNKPTCPSCGVLCKKSICRDYNSFVRRMEKKDADERSRQRMQNSRGRVRGNVRSRGHAKGGFGYRMEAIPTWPSVGKLSLLNSEERGEGIDKIESGSSTLSNNKIYGRNIEDNDDKTPVENAILRTTTSFSSTIQKAQTPNTESQNANQKPVISISSSSSCLNKIEPSPAIAWAKGNPITSKQSSLYVGTGKNNILDDGYFPALGAGSANGKVTHVQTTRSASATSVKPQAPTPGTTPFVGSNGLGSSGRPPVTSWAEIANSRARPATKPTVTSKAATVIPPPIGKVLTASVISSQEPLTISWEEVLKREMEVADFEEF
ncbi:hypothetical protein Clacol_002739 [Clathrus columnatus]|uniref:Uncharacterized protein n=1 Tax=Clathrus columnatus TaxID=1419009 RepID=A0AAV5A1J4_9AGAM|nr:hypothetical protein Clacol_002739 [Clathrus columnatus]